ncbi:MAG: nucleoside-diphosphate kinase [Candidatus Cloacimonetes bacterium]|nr:nucleoside-diphosphate kinase [Candidatus Cloacimonadota bacterium]
MAQCLVIIKPDAVKAGNVGKIISMIEDQRYRICFIHLTQLTHEKACIFYEEHRGKDFFERNAFFMSSGPIFVLLVEPLDIQQGETTIQMIEHLRDIIGDTDPKKASVGTIRQLFGTELPKNAIHVSDSEESLEREMVFFFEELNEE